MYPIHRSRYTAKQIEDMLEKAAEAAKPLTNCINCGAPLDGRSCPYCGTRHDSTVSISGEVSDITSEGILNLGGRDFRVYLSRVDVQCQDPDVGRDLTGRIVRDRLIRTFTLVEF